MSYLDELAIKEAVRNADSRLLLNTIHDMPFPSFEEIKTTMIGAGGSEYVGNNHIEMGNVRIFNHFGSPLVRFR